jgi:hypothetical protein
MPDPSPPKLVTLHYRPWLELTVAKMAIGSPEQFVAVKIELTHNEFTVAPLRTPAAVDELVAALLAHKAAVWPGAE